MTTPTSVPDDLRTPDATLDVAGSTVLALGVAGSQGTGLVDALRERDASPVLVSSRPEQVSAWLSAGERAALGDLRHATGLADVARDVAAVAAVLHVPLSLGGPDGAAAVVESVRSLRDHGLRVAVNVGTPVPAEEAPDPFGARSLAAALTATGAVVVSPTAYLENHVAPWALGPIAEGELVYPRPADDQVAWVATRDVTAAAAAALDAGAEGRVLPVAGPEVLTPGELASAIGDALGRTVRFRRVDADEWAALLTPALGEAAAKGVAAAYRAMPEESNPALSQDASTTWQLLGITPRTARTWAAETLVPRLAA
ncbi:MAG: hypothetical protein ACRCY8_01030 [Dermatophilaceae bacterium]